MDALKKFTVENNIYKGGMSSYTVNTSFGERIWTAIKSHGDKIIHVDACTEKVVTYAELQDKVVKCALWLQKRGIKLGDVVSVSTHNQLNSIVPCLAAIYINAIFNPWNERMDLQGALHVMRLITPKIIFCSEKSANVILSAIKESNCNPIVVSFGDHPDTISFCDILSMSSDAEVASFRYVEVDDIMQTTSYIALSSGTTGMPKGVEVSNYCLSHIMENKNSDLTNVVSIWFTSLYWISGLVLNLRSIIENTKVIIYPEFDEEMTCRLIEKYKITLMFLNTSMINRFLKAGYIKKYSLSSLKVIITGGSILKQKIQEEIRCILHIQILQGYGMTELCGLVTMQLPHHKAGSCGTIAEDVQIKIVDPENGKVLGPNKSGELWIKKVIMMSGYYRNPEATKNTIDEEGWLHSGDIGYFDEDGELFIVDRMKELIKYRGYQISPGEIEGVLALHPAIKEVAVIGVPHPTDDEHPIAYVTKMPGAKVTKQELIDLVANNMEDQYKLRAGVIFLDAFPYTGSGKIERKKLKTMTKKLAD